MMLMRVIKRLGATADGIRRVVFSPGVHDYTNNDIKHHEPVRRPCSVSCCLDHMILKFHESVGYL